MASKTYGAVLWASLQAATPEDGRSVPVEHRDMGVYLNNMAGFMKNSGGEVIEQGGHLIAALYKTTDDALDSALEFCRSVNEDEERPAADLAVNCRFVVDVWSSAEGGKPSILDADAIDLPGTSEKSAVWISSEACAALDDPRDVEFLPVGNRGAEAEFFLARSRLRGLRRPKIMGMGEGSEARSGVALWLGIGLLILGVIVALRDCYFSS